MNFDNIGRTQQPQIKHETLVNIQKMLSKVLKAHEKDQAVIDVVVLEWDPDEKRFNNSESQIKNIMNIAGSFMQEHGSGGNEYQMNQNMQYIKDNLNKMQIRPVARIMWPVGENMPGFFAHDKDEDLKNEEGMALYNICKNLSGTGTCRTTDNGQIIIKATELLDIIVKMVLDGEGGNSVFTGGKLIL